MNSPLLRRVLVVDDEPNIVSAVRRELNTPPLGRFRPFGVGDRKVTGLRIRWR